MQCLPAVDEKITVKKKETKRRRRNKNALRTIPPEIAADPELVKYWAQRYRLFSRFDEGIKLDRGVFSTKCADLSVYPRMCPNVWSFLQFITNFLKGGALLNVCLHLTPSRPVEVLDFRSAFSLGHPCLH